jgi:hypothetical protein
MTPAERAKEVLGASWLEDLEAHLLHGYVISTPTAFAMARPVPKGADVYGPWRTWPDEECDALFCWVAVGPLSEILAMVPRRFEWCGFMRMGRGWREIHWRPMAPLRKRLTGPVRTG